MAVNGTPSHSYGVSLAIRDHTVLPEHTLPMPTQTGQYSIYLPQRDARRGWPRWLVTWWFTRLQTVTHPITNRAQCRLTRLIKANALTTTLRRTFLLQVDLPQSEQPGFHPIAHYATTHCAYPRRDERL